MRISMSFTALLLALSIPSAPAFADEAYTFIIKKQEAKEPHKWSLAEWLETKDKIKIMDFWLAMHSPSPYEFFVGADSTLDGGWRVSGAAFASIVGLEGFKEKSRWAALFDLRFFGYHSQGTNLTFQVGVQSQDLGDGTSARSALAGADLTIYLLRFFGIQGILRHSFPPTPNSAGLFASGNRYDVNAFIDFNFLRLYGGYYNELGAAGATLGARIYF
jgi:hypothetical protein